MNAAVFIAIAHEAQYKDYLYIARLLRIDPAIMYEQDIIDQRAEALLSTLTENKKLSKKVASFKKNYKKMEGGFFGNRFITKAKKDLAKGKIILDYEVEP